MAQRTSSSNVAGPSTLTKRRKRSPSTTQSLGDEENPLVIEEDNDAEMKDARTSKVATKGGKTAVNGTAKGKGKAKIGTSIARKTAVTTRTHLDLDDTDDAAHGDTDNNSEIARLKQALEDCEQRTAELLHQNDELCRARETEPELLLREYQEIAEQRMADQDALIKQLNTTVAMTEPLLRDGKSNVLQLMTREAADEEKATLEREAKKNKRLAEDQAKALSDKDATIADLQEEVRLLKKELDAEIQQAKANNGRTSRPPGSATRGGGTLLGSEEPKKAKVISFYEDLTEVLVTNVKIEKCTLFADNPDDDCLLSCIYTYKDNDDPAIIQSLHFNLRLCHELDQTIQELVPSVLYSPLDLDKERPDFAAKLTFLSEAFSFRKEQLQIFLKTLADRVSEALQPSGNDDDDDEDDVLLVS